MMQLKMSAKGEIVIPKKVRDQLGLLRERKIFLTVKDNEVILKPIKSDEDIVKKWAERAHRLNVDVSKWVYGDKLYEEVFGEKWAAKLLKRQRRV